MPHVCPTTSGQHVSIQSLTFVRSHVLSLYITSSVPLTNNSIPPRTDPANLPPALCVGTFSYIVPCLLLMLWIIYLNTEFAEKSFGEFFQTKDKLGGTPGLGRTALGITFAEASVEKGTGCGRAKEREKIPAKFVLTERATNRQVGCFFAGDFLDAHVPFLRTTQIVLFSRAHCLLYLLCRIIVPTISPQTTAPFPPHPLPKDVWRISPSPDLLPKNSPRSSSAASMCPARRNSRWPWSRPTNKTKQRSPLLGVRFRWSRPTHTSPG